MMSLKKATRKTGVYQKTDGGYQARGVPIVTGAAWQQFRTPDGATCNTRKGSSLCTRSLSFQVTFGADNRPPYIYVQRIPYDDGVKLIGRHVFYFVSPSNWCTALQSFSPNTNWVCEVDEPTASDDTQILV